MTPLPFTTRTRIAHCLTILGLLLLAGCAPPPEASIEPTAAAALPTRTETPGIAADEATPQPSPSATPAPLEIFLSASLPVPLGTIALPESLVVNTDPGADFWFGPGFDAPEGQVLHTVQWVYALAAPFPTLVDSVTWQELQALWQGFHTGGFQSINALYLPEAAAHHLEQQWGPNVGTDIIISSALPDIEALWEENAWAVIPFDQLDPKLKVIQLDGQSPLYKDFSTDDYPLTLTFALTQKTGSGAGDPPGSVRDWVAALPESNRDPGKMTTLVMTGVTALVRATADRMETKGVLYPGEDIRPWLVEADLTHISNEVSFYEDCPPPDKDSRSLFFCSDPKYIELLEYVGADIIELTGNHNNDMLRREGKYLVPYNLSLYQERGMSTFGGGLNIVAARSPLTLTHNGNRLAFIGCNAPGPEFAWADQYQGGAAPCGDFQWMVEEIQRLKAEGYLPIATFQYYEDYYNFAETHHWRDFGLVADAGAVILNGSQAHRPKAMTFIGDTLVDFGLGNLFFDQMGYTDMYGNNLQQVRWEKIQRHTFYDGRHISTEILTAMLEDYARPRPMTPEERLVFLEEIFSASDWNSR